MDLNSPNLLLEGNRLSRQAQEAERKGHYRQALDKYTKAVAKYRQASETRQHPKCREVLHLLIASVQRNADYVQSYLDKDLSYRSKRYTASRSRTMASDSIVAKLAKYVDEFSRAMYKVLESSPGASVAERLDTEPSAMTTSQRSDCLRELNRFREQFENEFVKAGRSDWISEAITKAEQDRAQDNLRTLEANLAKSKAALEEAQSVIESQRNTIEEQRKVIEKYQTQWRQLKERARMKRS